MHAQSHQNRMCFFVGFDVFLRFVGYFRVPLTLGINPEIPWKVPLTLFARPYFQIRTVNVIKVDQQLIKFDQSWS